MLARSQLAHRCALALTAAVSDAQEGEERFNGAEVIDQYVTITPKVLGGAGWYHAEESSSCPPWDTVRSMLVKPAARCFSVRPGTADAPFLKHRGNKSAKSPQGFICRADSVKALIFRTEEGRGGTIGSN